MPKVDKSKILKKIEALMARASSPEVEEARTSAMLAIQLMKEYGLKPGDPSEYARQNGSLGGQARAMNLTDEELGQIASMGGRARSAHMSQERRSEIAKKAGLASAAARKARKATSG